MAIERLRAPVVAALLLSGVTPAFAQDAWLTSRDGTISLEGTMLGFDGEFYRLSTEYGAISVDAQGVTCDGPGCPDLADYVAEIRISGARTMGDVLMPALVETFALRNGYLPRRVVQDDVAFRYDLTDPTQDRLIARFHFNLATTDEGFADLVADEADVVMAVREVNEAEIAHALDAGLGDLSGPQRARIVALDGLVPIVSPVNPLRDISLEALTAIRSGNLRDWHDLIGLSAPIDLHEKVGDAGLAVGGVEPEDPQPGGWRVQHESASGLVASVARSPEALGLTPFSQMGTARALRLTGPCGRSLSVSSASLKAEDYPLAMPLYLYVPARRLPLLAREFLGWLSTPAAELVVRRAGYVDQVPMLIPLGAQGDRLANAIQAAGEEVSLEDLREMIEAMRGAERLTTTFRFRGGAAALDPQSEGNVARLARDIEAGVYDDRQITLAGFSDGRGDAATNRKLALQRAQSVEAAVRDAAPTADWNKLVLRAIAFGEALPLACDDSVWGRQANRRVEVWIR